MKKGVIGWSVTGVCVLILIWAVIVVAGVGNEASKMDALLKDDISKHTPVADVKKQLADAGYSIQQETPTLKATGPKHSLVVYTTWLTLDLGFNESGGLTSYHLERAS